MIFSVSNHVQQIIRGEKTQTRRRSNRYRVGETYAIQSGRTKAAILEGRILILTKKREICCKPLSIESAKAEGGYTPEQFEELFRKMDPYWITRFAYTFQFQATEKEVKK